LIIVRSFAVRWTLSQSRSSLLAQNETAPL
jgi:hypothetical protein